MRPRANVTRSQWPKGKDLCPPKFILKTQRVREKELNDEKTDRQRDQEADCKQKMKIRTGKKDKDI